MDASELSELEKVVNKLKFKAGQEASALHDLIEDRLLSDFEEIPLYAGKAYNACKAWSIKNNELINAKR